MLNSKECPSLKHMVQKTIQKFTSTESFLDDDTVLDEDEEELEKKPTARTTTKNTTFSHLTSWYSNVVIKTPLIIILQDLESFSTQQLQDFVLLCRYIILSFNRCINVCFFIIRNYLVDVVESTALEVNCQYNSSWALLQQLCFSKNFITVLQFA